MESKFNKIFNQDFPVTKQELRDYFSGNLSPAEMHKIELKIESSDLSSEALEGFLDHPEAFAQLHELDNSFEKQLKTQKSWTSSHTLLAAAIAGILVVAGGYWLNEGVGTNSKVAVAENLSNEKETATQEVHFKISEPIVITEEIEKEVEEANLLPENRQLTADFIETHQPITVEAEDDVSDDELDSLVQQIAVPAPLSPINTEEINTIESSKVVRSNIKVVYAHNFLLVDYTELYSDGIQKQVIQHDLHNGTPVWLENRRDSAHDIHTEPIVQIVKVDYLKFMDEVQFKFKKNQYKKALKDYHQVLKQYPQDVNALFYGGLCYYNLDKPERALQYFDNLIHNAVNTFRQEGQFYKAMSLIAMNKHGQGNGLLLQISEEGGFYAQQAKELLDNL